MRAAALLLAVCLASLPLGEVRAAASDAHWLRAESAHFIVYSQETADALRQAVLDLETYDETMSIKTGWRLEGPAPKLSVYLVHDLSALNDAVPDLPKGADGFYTANAELVGAMAVFGQGNHPVYAGGIETLFHEYAHHFMAQHSPAAYPTWYVEGFAEYFGATELKPDTVDVGRVPADRAAELVYARWLPFRAILFGNLWGVPAEQRGQFYGQSWLLTHYMFSSPERVQKLGVYLDKVNDGTPSIDAFRQAFGEEPEALDTEVLAYAKGPLHYERIPRPQTVGANTVAITQMPRSADELILYDFRIKADSRQQFGADTIDVVRRLAAHYPDDAFAQSVLARAETFYGSPAAAEKIADAALATAPEDPDWLYLKGIALLRRGAQAPDQRVALFREGRKALALANKIRPDDVPTLYRYARSFVNEPGEPSKATTGILVRAMTLSPQIDEIVLTTCYALMKQGEFTLATNKLKRVANAPHSVRLAETSQLLLSYAEKRKVPASASPAP